MVVESEEEDTTPIPSDEMAAMKKGKRINWSTEEIETLRRSFSKEYHSNVLPGFAKIRKIIEKHPILKQRNPAAVKSRFQYMLKQKWQK
ncbi:hypothetical protein BSL78_06476 [Apostichopus japonicus]|uniref:Uncharacterized protein n=1 Tax=Stichopus japonicus TaxID=307972 RepID=A0A2G8L8Z4_STIJA|nr:hypothetical protein BSL78_06476 [Apostichopus japonicus]